MPLGGVIFIVLFIALFGAFLIWVATKTGGKPKYHKVKYEPYECGLPSLEKKDSKVSVKYYLTAILFILFDIEIIFMYPWALTFKDFLSQSLGWYSLMAMGFFLLVFIFGLFWEVKSKALEWE